MDASSGEALVADPAGQRLGVDPMTLQGVNDFNVDGADGGKGDVRILAIKNALPGTYCLETQSAVKSDYAVNVYSVEGSKSGGLRVRRTAATGLVNSFSFTLFRDGAIRWTALPHESDFNGDTYVDVADLAMQLACATGPALAYDPGNVPAGCSGSPDVDGVLPGDLDRNGFIDLRDFAGLQASFSGADPVAFIPCQKGFAGVRFP